MAPNVSPAGRGDGSGPREGSRVTVRKASRDGRTCPYGLRGAYRDAIVERCAPIPPLPGRVRLVITLSVVSAVMVMAGGILVVASTATHLIGRHSGVHVTSLGVALGVAGLAVGLVTCWFSRSPGPEGQAGRPRRPAGHRHRATASAGPGRERGRVLKPTSVYSPGGLIDVPRDARAPGSAGAARSSGFDGPQGTTRPPASAGRSRGLQAADRGRRFTRHQARSRRPSQARLAAGRMGTAPPRPGYQAGAHPAPGTGSRLGTAAGQAGQAGAAGRAPQQPMPPQGRMRPGEAFPPRDAFPPREPAAAARPPLPAPRRPGCPREGRPSRRDPGARPRAPFREGPPPRPGAAAPRELPA